MEGIEETISELKDRAIDKIHVNKYIYIYIKGNGWQQRYKGWEVRIRIILLL